MQLFLLFFKIIYYVIFDFTLEKQFSFFFWGKKQFSLLVGQI